MTHSKQDIFVSQQKYIIDLLKETNKTACKVASIPIDSNLKFKMVDKDASMTIVDKEMYQYLVEKIIYLSYTQLT